MNPTTPYKGLMPYSEEDAPFFFGREDEREIIIANLMAARLTLLYGTSGVGKSSVLRAGVVHHLQVTAQRNLFERGAPEFVVVNFASWRDDPVVALAARVRDSTERVLGPERMGTIPEPAPCSLAEILRAWTEHVKGDLLIILDQFEEYFLYHPQPDGERSFAAEFARAINCRDLRVSFLISMRDDALAKLDRFKGHIPNLFDNYLRIEHLDREAARAAIEKPIAQYNRLHRDQPPVGIEPQLVEAVLDQVRAGRVGLDRERSGIGEDEKDAHVEAPYLQLVMTRLWNEERRLGSDVLQLQTLNRLGGADRIWCTHLDSTMRQMPNAEQLIAARAFRYLVTPSGTKIAYTVSDLANYAHVAPSHLSPVLQKLSGAEMRLLRAVAPSSGDQQESRYEIFHDVLAPAILDWRGRYMSGIRSRRVRVVGSALGVVIAAVILALVAFGLYQTDQAASKRRLLATTLPIVAAVAAQPSPAPDTTGPPINQAVRETAIAVTTSVAQVQQVWPAPPMPTPLPSRTALPTATARPTATGTQIATPGIGSTFMGRDGGKMLFIPAGEFLMGSSNDDRDAASDEKPQHRVFLDAFWMDKFPNTNGLYKKCVDAGVCSAPAEAASRTHAAYFANPQFDSYPVIYVSWQDASTYCAWVGERLPTEAEWEKAARGTYGWIYPWGNSFDSTRLNWRDSGLGDTTAVGSFPGGASMYGVADMAGNVYGWVADWYDPNYSLSSANTNPKGPSTGSARILRGGAWNSPRGDVRAANREPQVPGHRELDVGFRCARQLGRDSLF